VIAVGKARIGLRTNIEGIPCCAKLLSPNINYYELELIP
jgi:hypothetical protein